MPTHSTLNPIDAAAKAVDALLAAIEGNPGSGAITAYRAALTRHGRNLVDTAGPEALATALARIRNGAPDKAAGEARAAIVLEAWQGLMQERAA